MKFKLAMITLKIVPNICSIKKGSRISIYYLFLLVLFYIQSPVMKERLLNDNL